MRQPRPKSAGARIRPAEPGLGNSHVGKPVNGLFYEEVDLKNYLSSVDIKAELQNEIKCEKLHQ